MSNRPAEPEIVFVVGCQRSGTTWLQLLLARHPAVATANETHLVDRLLGPMLNAWQDQVGEVRDVGFPTLFTEEEYLDLLRGVAAEVVDRIGHPECRVVVEKTPDHALWTDALVTLFPDARVLHLVRDPRDVTASLLAAAADWGAHWAPSTAFDAAWRWLEYVRGARRAADRTDRYRELRYEDLYAAPDEELGALFEWLSVSASPERVAEAVEETRLDRMRDGSAEAPWDLKGEPEGFVRKGGTGNWRDELTAGQARVVEYLCADLMDDLGYPSGRRRRIPPLGFYRPWLRDQLSRLFC